MQISNHFNTWDWVRDVLVPGLFEDGKYFTLNSSSPYIGDGDAVLVGMPRLRQLRVKEGILRNCINVDQNMLLVLTASTRPI